MTSPTAFDKDRLARMHDVLGRRVEHTALPGLVTGLSRHGEVHLDTIGTLSTDGGQQMQADTIFRISSMTKPITALATMILIEECLLRLDDPVGDLLPELAAPRVLRRPDSELDDTVPADRPITVRDLLTFVPGFGMILAAPGSLPIQRAHTEALGADGPPSPSSTGLSPDDWLAKLAGLPLVHQPGHCWMYNTPCDVLGVLIARASGQSFEAFLAERIFHPLGMADTGFSVPLTDIHRLATSYTTDPQTGAVMVYDPAEGGRWSTPPAMASGAGGLVSTVHDYLAFAELLAGLGRRGEVRLLSRPAVELMTTDQLTPAQKAATSWIGEPFATSGWGFGLSVRTRRDGLASIGSYGWDGGMGTCWANDPREGLVGVLLTQQNWTSPAPPPVCTDFWTCAYQSLAD